MGDWKPVTLDDPIFYCRGGIQLEQYYLYEIWYSNGDTDVIASKKDAYNKYILSTESDVNEDASKHIHKGYIIITINRLCKEEEISGTLLKESLVSQFCDKLETILLKYRTTAKNDMGENIELKTLLGDNSSCSGEESIRNMTDFIFNWLLSDWKTEEKKND